MYAYFSVLPRLAALGPPSRVELAPVGNLLDVTISDPLTSTQGSMKEHVLSLYYHILYWNLSDDPRVLSFLTSTDFSDSYFIGGKYIVVDMWWLT